MINMHIVVCRNGSMPTRAHDWLAATALGPLTSLWLKQIQPSSGLSALTNLQAREPYGTCVCCRTGGAEPSLSPPACTG